MAKFEIVMPKMGESIIEATITRWLKGVGDAVNEEDPLVEIATDKVDSEIPSPVDGKVLSLLFKEGDVVPVGAVIAIIGTEGEEESGSAPAAPETTAAPAPLPAASAETAAPITVPEEPQTETTRFYSPLVRSMAKQENISMAQLESIIGTGKDGRLTKDDLLAWLRNPAKADATLASAKTPASSPAQAAVVVTQPAVSASASDTIIEMDRMRKLIADHMVMSSHVSPHVTSFIEIDCTNIVNWRNRIKNDFEKREGEKITYTPLFVEAAARALREFPNVNASVDGYNIIQRRNINIGLAAALPNGNLIVPVIKNADQKNIVGLVKSVNDLANRARQNKLQPDEIQEGTFTITNLGTFGSLTGTPIINQPQVAILALGAITKKPVVLETPQGDVIAVRQMMIMSLAYDHRVVDGALGGQFLYRMKQIIENFELNREF